MANATSPTSQIGGPALHIAVTRRGVEDLAGRGRPANQALEKGRPGMDQGIARRLQVTPQVTAWDCDGKLVLEIPIGQPLSPEQLEQLARLTSLHLKVILNPGSIGA